MGRSIQVIDVSAGMAKKAYQAAYREAHREELRAKSKKNRALNLEGFRAAERAYYAVNQPRIRAQNMRSKAAARARRKASD